MGWSLPGQIRPFTAVALTPSITPKAVTADGATTDRDCTKVVASVLFTGGPLDDRQRVQPPGRSRRQAHPVASVKNAVGQGA